MSHLDRWGQVNLFLKSFKTSSEAFRWLGEHSSTELDTYLESLQPTDGAPINTKPERRNSAPAELRSSKYAMRPPIKLPLDSSPVLVFDTETTGLSPSIICQLAYVIIDDSGITEKVDQILRLPEGVTIQQQAVQIHGITNERCHNEGVDARQALKEFANAVDRILSRSGKIIGHNVAFDVRAVAQTRAAHKMPPSEIKETFCLMKKSYAHSPLKNRLNKKKQFRNDELYEHLYKRKPDWARLHSAYDDVCVAALNYIGGLNNMWW